MNPHFQRGVAYGDRFDAAILCGRRAGLTLQAIADDIGISNWFVSGRARAMGYGTTSKPPLSRRVDIDFARPVRRAANPSRVAAFVAASRSDRGPSRLARDLRGQIIVLDRDGLDPSHGVACLHAAGLTLPEIERLTGVPARAAVEAIRRHGPSIHAAGVRS